MGGGGSGEEGGEGGEGEADSGEVCFVFVYSYSIPEGI